MPMQPAAEHDIGRKSRRHSRQIQKHGLGNVFGEVFIAVQKPERRGINQVNVAADDLAERGVRAAAGVFGEQLLALGHLQSAVKTRRGSKPNKKIRGSVKWLNR